LFTSLVISEQLLPQLNSSAGQLRHSPSAQASASVARQQSCPEPQRMLST
jgi:hypothetical protein